MRIKIDATRWSEPIIEECSEIRITADPNRPNYIVLWSPEGGTLNVELGPYGETLEILPS